MLTIKLTRPSEAELEALLPSLARESFTYTDVGASREATLPAGYHHASLRRRIGNASRFDAARAAMQRFEAQRGAGSIVVTSGSAAPDVVVAQVAKLPVAGWIYAMCRIVYVVDEPDRYQWAYGTLNAHPEVGEECFTLTREGNDLFYEVRAFSNASHPLVTLGGPITWKLQRMAMEKYADAIERAARG